jgi:hypothetical protein
VEDEAWAYIAQNGGQPQAAQEAAQAIAQQEAQQAAPRSDAAEAEGGAPEAGAAAARQEAEAPATGAQEAEAPEVAVQEAGEPGTGAPEAAEPDATAPEAGAQGAEALLAAALEAGAQAADVLLEEAEAQAAEAAKAESQGAAAPEAGAPEIAEREAAAPETGALDAEAQDAAAQETEAPPAFYGARPSAPNAGDSPDSQAALSAPSEAWLPAVPGASAAEAAYEALAEDLAFGIKDLASRLRAAIDGLVRLPSELPAERRKMSAGVFELAGDKEFVIERTMGPATADYAFIGEGFQDVGSFSVLLSFRTADVAGCTVSLPEWLASDAYVLADSAPPYMPGYTTYAIDVIARDKTFSAGDGETILDVSLTLSGKTTRIVSLVLSSFDAVYYDEAFDGGKYDIEADASITRAVASTRVSFASRFDANRDGIVNLVDVNRTRQYMGSVLDENGWRPSQAAWSCDIGGGLGNAPDGIVNVVDLTLVIAAYEATVP